MRTATLAVELGATSLALAITLSAAPLQSAGDAVQAAGDAESGKQLYTTLGCAACHGTAGEGGAAPRIAPASDLPTFTRALRQPLGNMPVYAPSRVTDAQVTDLHSFLRAAGATGGGSAAGASASDTPPPGNAASGKKLFETTGCWSCHGYAGQGGSAGPRLGPPPIAYSAFMAALRHPRNEMPPYTAKVLPDAQVADLYAYVKTFPQPPDPDSIPLLNPTPASKRPPEAIRHARHPTDTHNGAIAVGAGQGGPRLW